MDKLRNMAWFCRVVELGSFVQAAEHLQVTPAIVGRHMGKLEQSLGVRLLNRTTRTMEVTAAGQDYYHGCKRILSSLDQLEQSLLEVVPHEPKGLLRVAAPDGFASPYLLDLVVRFQAMYPQIQIDIIADNGKTDMVKDSIDLSLRFAFALEDSSKVAFPLTTTPLALFASTHYLKKHGRPRSIEDLTKHDCLHFGASRYAGHWPIMKDGKGQKLNLPWKLSFSNTHVYVDALDRGLGIGLLPAIFAKGLSKGELQLIDGVFDFHTITIHGVYGSRQYMPERLKLFLQFLKDAFAKQQDESS